MKKLGKNFYILIGDSSWTGWEKFYRDRVTLLKIGFLKRLIAYPVYLFIYLVKRALRKTNYVPTIEDAHRNIDDYLLSCTKEELLELIDLQKDYKPSESRGRGEDIPQIYKRIFYADGNISGDNK